MKLHAHPQFAASILSQASQITNQNTALTRKRKERYLGISLIELLCILSIAATLALVGLAYLSDQSSTGQARRISQNIHQDLQQGRQFSRLQQQSISFCLSTDTLSCAKQGEHWIGFHDQNADGKRNLKQEPLLVQRHLRSRHVSVATIGSKKIATFRSNGFAKSFLSFIICDSKKLRGYKNTINFSGRTRIKVLTKDDADFKHCHI